jgi:hypothetical protein
VLDGRAGRVTQRLSVLVITAVMAMTVLSACGPDPQAVDPTSPLAHRTSTTSPTTTAVARISDSISLSTTRAVAGTTIKGVFIVNNPGGPIKLTDSDGCHPAYGVTLTTLAFGLPCIGAPLTIKHGTNRFPVTVSTSYQECLPPGGTSSVPVPKCVEGKIPPLPPGTYHAKLASEGLDLPTPRPVTVRLTP